MSNNDNDTISKMIKYCIDSAKYTSGMEFEEFNNNELYLTFSVFALSQLGELVSRLSEEIKAEYDEIPWNAIKSIRNRIVHDYEGVQYRIIWDTIKDDIPELIKEFEIIGNTLNRIDLEDEDEINEN